MVVNNIELIVEPKTGIGYSEGEATQVYPASHEWPIGGMDAQTIVDAVSPGSAWSFSAKDVGEDRINTVLIFSNTAQ
jgi:hypothetical protein